MLQLMIRPLSFLTLVVILGLGINYAFASVWTNPTQSPPGGNTPTPINVGPTHQVKSGGLWVGSLGTTGGATFGGNVGIGTTNPQSRLDINGDIRFSSRNNPTLYFASPDNGIIGADRDIAFTTNGLGVANERVRIMRNGNVGIGTTLPGHPLHMGSGAHVTIGGVWTNASSREQKENIRDISYNEAKSALMSLKPVKFNYKAERDNNYLGFIAEDSPYLVATKDRKGLNSMDIVAVLTKVVQQQQIEIEKLKAEIKKLKPRPAN